MRIRLKNQEQAQGFYDLIIYLLKANPFSNRREKILDLAMFRISEKVRAKLISRHPRNYDLVLDEEDSLTLEEWFSENEGSIPHNQYVYELNIATQITNQINKAYG